MSKAATNEACPVANKFTRQLLLALPHAIPMASCHLKLIAHLIACFTMAHDADYDSSSWARVYVVDASHCRAGFSVVDN